MPKRKSPRLRWAYTLGPIAAAALLLIVVRGKKPDDPDVTSERRTKGGGVAFTLVREDGTPFAGDRADFRSAGDRFRAQVTCPEGAVDAVDLVVFSDGKAIFPVPAVRITCGNEVSIEGTFRAFGATEMRVCLLWNDGPELVDRALVQDGGEKAVVHAACKTLFPVR